jgi:hypothetical protein
MRKEEVREALASRYSAGVYGIGADPLSKENDLIDPVFNHGCPRFGGLCPTSG